MDKDDEKEHWVKLWLQVEASLYFEKRGWQERTDGRFYPPRGNHSMSIEDAVYQIEMAASGEEVPF